MTRILIVGGGIAGLALGRALREQGVVPEIIARAASWPTGGTGLYLPGNGVRALGALGLADKLMARAVRMSHQRILDHTGRRLAEIELSKFWNPGRVVLIGDAAHATSPNMAEGASMALEDALVLVQMLAVYGSPDKALSAFSERRRPRIRWVQQTTR